MAIVDWYVEGRAFGNCNCRYGCPCQFEDLPSQGFCMGFEVLQIEKGHFGDLDLSGLRTALFYRWPGPIFEGNGEMQAIIDERANEKQRDALRRVLHGEETEEAKTHWWVFATMATTHHPALFKPINMDINIEGRTAKVSIPDLLTATGRPIKPPHGGPDHRVQIAIPQGIEFELAEIGSASSSSNGVISFELSDSYGQWNILRHSGTGVVH